MRFVISRDGEKFKTPLFLPVYKYQNEYLTPQMILDFGFKGMITNAFFLYKEEKYKKTVLEKGIKDFFGFKGLVMTDSGAFQGFTRPLYLSNKKIVEFQEKIGADIISPLDLVSPPWEKKEEARKKLYSTMERIEEAKGVLGEGILNGVQQGAKYLDLRLESIKFIERLGLKYISIGSLVPFFNKNHDLEFVQKVIKQARENVAFNKPIHLFGAGDPLEIPFYLMMGVDIFDSSSFIHYAKEGYYMTPFGSFIDKNELLLSGFKCDCKYCQKGLEKVLASKKLLVYHNLSVISKVFSKIEKLKKEHKLSPYLKAIAKKNKRFFPDSKLFFSWEKVSNYYKNLERMIKEETPKIIKQYKISENEAKIKIEEQIETDAMLFKHFNGFSSFKSLKKNSFYKKLIKRIKKDIYYSLRTFKTLDKESDESLAGQLKEADQSKGKEGVAKVKTRILKWHKSTSERIEHMEFVNRKLTAYIKDAKNILDVGSGVYPVSFLFDEAKQLKEYYCIEKDNESREILETFFMLEDKVKAKIIDPEKKNFDWVKILKNKRYDLVFMFKLVPLLLRYQSKALDYLKEINAKKIIISASTESLTKRKNIKRKQNKILKKFIKNSKRKVIDSFEVENEIFYVIK